MWHQIYKDLEFWHRLNELLKLPGMTIDEEGVITEKGAKHTQTLDFPWIHFGGKSPNRNCMRWLLLWNIFHMVPCFCRHNCFKITVKPETIGEMYRASKIAEGLGLPGKYGIDVREITGDKYGMFFYPNSWEEASQFLEIIKDALKDVISTPPFIKRMCTEMEALYPTPAEIPDDIVRRWDDWEWRLDDIFVCRQRDMVVPAWIKSARWINWCKKAKQWGDKTYKEVVGDIEFVKEIKSIRYDVKKATKEELSKLKGETK